MTRFLKYLIIILSMLALYRPVLAFDSKSIVKIDAPYATLYPGTFDNLVLDFAILTARPDTLKAVSLKNLGTADNLNQISYLTFWADSGPAGFQGLGIDRKIGNFKYFGALQNWYLDYLNERINGSQRFFVSAEIYSAISKPAIIQLQIPRLVDSNENNSFNLADLGIFMDSGNNGPTDKELANANMQVISTTHKDIYPPKINIVNLENKQIINNNSYLIKGVARDQGNSGIYDLKININGLEVEPVYNQTDYSWQYLWQDMADGNYIISVSGRDQYFNSSQTEEITVTVVKQILSLENSHVSLNRPIIRNDGLDKAIVSAKLIDINQQVISGRQVYLESSEVISQPYLFTDQNGEANFEVRSTVLGPKKLIIKSDGQILAELNLVVNLSGADISSGDLIKASGPAVYYFGANGKRYVFPNSDIYFSWYNDFKMVKTIKDSELAAIPLGGNVTYKPGTKLIKIATDPKVYAIDSGGTLRWIKTESVAKSLFGNDWNKKIIDVSVALFGDYKQGLPIEKAGDYNLAGVKLIASINEDKGF